MKEGFLKCWMRGKTCMFCVANTHFETWRNASDRPCFQKQNCFYGHWEDSIAIIKFLPRLISDRELKKGTHLNKYYTSTLLYFLQQIEFSIKVYLHSELEQK